MTEGYIATTPRQRRTRAGAAVITRAASRGSLLQTPVWIIEHRMRRCMLQQWEPAGDRWFLAAAEAKMHARAMKSSRYGAFYVHRVRRYLLVPDSEAGRG